MKFLLFFLLSGTLSVAVIGQNNDKISVPTDEPYPFGSISLLNSGNDFLQRPDKENKSPGFLRLTAGTLMVGESFQEEETGNIKWLDNGGIKFSSFSTINVANYLDKETIGSFEFTKNLLSDNEGFSFPISTTSFSSSLSPFISAGPGNGGFITERGIYQVDWQGTGNTSFASLEAPGADKAVSFILDPGANLSPLNQQGYFAVQADENRFIVGISSNTKGFIGFESPSQTSLVLSADTLFFSGIAITNQVRTNHLFVGNLDDDKIFTEKNSIACFGSNDPGGSFIMLANSNPDLETGTGLIFQTANSRNRLISYSENYQNSTYAGTLSLETNSHGGIIFSLQSPSDLTQPSIRVLFNEKETFVIRATSTTIKTAITLQPITEEEMMDISNPEDGTIINNKTRKELLIYKDDQWFQFQLKPAKVIKKKNYRSI